MNQKRLLDGDPKELRDSYLFDFAHVCHLGPREVDVLRYLDFCNLILQIDNYHKSNQEALDKMKNIGG